VILITGGLGFIGSHITYQLILNGYDVVVLDNLVNSKISTYFKLKKIPNSSIKFLNLDINNFYEIDKFLQKNKINSVIHCAGLKSVSESYLYPGLYYYNNVLGSKNLFSLIRKNNIINLIFSSSATVYGKPIYLPIDENHPVRATNPYARNKIDIEKLLTSDIYFQNECSVKILRYFNPVGAHPSGILGEEPNGIPNNLMPYITKVAKKELPFVSVFGNDYETHDGTGVRDYIHIMDLVDGHMQALNYHKKGISIFNLGTNKGYSVLDLISTFVMINGINIPYKIVDRRIGDLDAVFSNSNHAKKILNFSAKRGIEDMCLDAWKYTRKFY